MGKARPAKRRDRRKGVSPYVKHGKTPQRYERRVVDHPSAEQPHMRRGRIHSGVHSREYLNV